MYVKYKYKDKTLFTFATVRYWCPCHMCGQTTTRKLLTSKGVLAKELFAAGSRLSSGYSYDAMFFCSEACIKKAIFTYSIKGGVKIRKRIEPWLNAPPQEYFLGFGEKYTYSPNKKDFHLHNKNLIRVIKNQDGEVNFVEFYEVGPSYTSHRPIHFFATDEHIYTVLDGIKNLMDQKEVEEKNA